MAFIRDPNNPFQLTFVPDHLAPQSVEQAPDAPFVQGGELPPPPLPPEPIPEPDVISEAAPDVPFPEDFRSPEELTPEEAAAAEENNLALQEGPDVVSGAAPTVTPEQASQIAEEDQQFVEDVNAPTSVEKLTGLLGRGQLKGMSPEEQAAAKRAEGINQKAEETAGRLGATIHELNTIQTLEDVTIEEAKAKSAAKQKELETIAKEKPESFFASRNMLGKVSIAVGSFLGGLLAPFQGGRNMFLERLDRLASQDYQEQIRNIESRKGALTRGQQLIQRDLDTFKDHVDGLREHQMRVLKLAQFQADELSKKVTNQDVLAKLMEQKRLLAEAEGDKLLKRTERLSKIGLDQARTAELKTRAVKNLRGKGGGGGGGRAGALGVSTGIEAVPRTGGAVGNPHFLKDTDLPEGATGSLKYAKTGQALTPKEYERVIFSQGANPVGMAQDKQQRKDLQDKLGRYNTAFDLMNEVITFKAEYNKLGNKWGFNHQLVQKFLDRRRQQMQGFLNALVTQFGKAAGEERMSNEDFNHYRDAIPDFDHLLNNDPIPYYKTMQGQWAKNITGEFRRAGLSLFDPTAIPTKLAASARSTETEQEDAKFQSEVDNLKSEDETVVVSGIDAISSSVEGGIASGDRKKLKAAEKSLTELIKSGQLSERNLSKAKLALSKVHKGLSRAPLETQSGTDTRAIKEEEKRFIAEGMDPGKAKRLARDVVEERQTVQREKVQRIDEARKAINKSLKGPKFTSKGHLRESIQAALVLKNVDSLRPVTDKERKQGEIVVRLGRKAGQKKLPRVRTIAQVNKWLEPYGITAEELGIK